MDMTCFSQVNMPVVAERISSFAVSADLRALICSSSVTRCLLEVSRRRTIAGCVSMSVVSQGADVPDFVCIDRCVVASSGAVQIAWPTTDAITREWPIATCFYLKHTTVKGWGVYAKVPIPSNTAVCAYVGEVIRSSELLERRKQYDEQGLNYVLTVREISPCGFTLRTNIDATSCGNIARFINHGCDPSLRLDAIRTAHHVIPELVFITTRALGVGDELTFDYGGLRSEDSVSSVDAGDKHGKRGVDGLDGIEEGSSQNSQKKRKVCRCGAATCRHWLPFDPTA